MVTLNLKLFFFFLVETLLLDVDVVIKNCVINSLENHDSRAHVLEAVERRCQATVTRPVPSTYIRTSFIHW